MDKQQMRRKLLVFCLFLIGIVSLGVGIALVMPAKSNSKTDSSEQIRLGNSVDNSAEIEIISSSVYGASTSSQTSETSTSILSESTEFSTTESSMSSMLFHVRSNWNDPASEIGAWQSIDDAISACSEGYYVFDDGGNIVFAPSNNETSSEATTEPIIIQFQNVLAEAHSHHTVNYNYVNNVTLACAAIDGTIVMPGEEFSFNKAVGVQTVEKGYREALVYTGGQSKPEIGGGVCQVASIMVPGIWTTGLKKCVNMV